MSAREPVLIEGRAADEGLVENAFEIPDGHKFGMAVLFRGRAGEGSVTVAEGCQVTFGPPPAALPAHWRQWFGTLRADRFRESGLVIIATEKSVSPGTADDQTVNLGYAVREVLIGILLHGSFRSDGGMVLSGERIGDEIEVRQASDLPPLRHVVGSVSSLPEKVNLADAWSIA